MDWIWLIVAGVVVIAKLLGNINAASEVDEEAAAPPPPTPRPRAARPKPAPRTATPRSATPPPVRSAAPAKPVKPKSEWAAAPDQIRRFLEQMQKQMQTLQHPPVAVPPPIRQAQPVPPPPPPPPPPTTKPAPAPEPVRKPARPNVWAEALRDKNNLRNIIISAEIIGTPKGA